jgi:hypothetical protein
MVGRSALALATLLVVASACASAPAPSPSPVVTPSPTAATPAISPSAAPTTPSPSPSVPPSPSPSPSPSPTPAPTAPAGSAADTFLFSDDFADPASGWGTGEQPSGQVAYVDGRFSITFQQAIRSLWGWRPVTPAGDQAWQVLRVGGTVEVGGPRGAAGWLCGASEPEGGARFLGGVVTGGGEWVIVSIVGKEVTALQRGALTAPPPGPLDLAVECLPEGQAVAVVVTLAGAEVGRATAEGGPLAWDMAGAYADTSEAGFSARFDDVLVHGGRPAGG